MESAVLFAQLFVLVGKRGNVGISNIYHTLLWFDHRSDISLY